VKGNVDQTERALTVTVRYAAGRFASSVLTTSMDSGVKAAQEWTEPQYRAWHVQSPIPVPVNRRQCSQWLQA